MKIRFGAFDAVHPNGIVALGDGKAIFAIRPAKGRGRVTVLR